ncbi:MAG: hypothetical protein ACRCXZ_08495 [Patescibacteria group bacterium]
MGFVFKLKRKTVKKAIFIDCLGAIDCPNVTGVNNYISGELYSQCQKENPNRSVDNQEATAQYLISIRNDILKRHKTSEGQYDGTEIHLMGTKAEVLTARMFFQTEFQDIEVFVKPLGMISTADKFKYVREYEKKNYSVELYSDQKIGVVYQMMVGLIQSFCHVYLIDRPVLKPEKVFPPFVLVKTLFRYASYK